MLWPFINSKQQQEGQVERGGGCGGGVLVSSLFLCFLEAEDQPPSPTGNSVSSDSLFFLSCFSISLFHINSESESDSVSSYIQKAHCFWFLKSNCIGTLWRLFFMYIVGGCVIVLSI